jgi:hypothetical protein
VAEYRDATSALRARVASRQAELVEVERELEGRRAHHDRLSLEKASLETALARAIERPARRGMLERVLLSALIAPAAGGLGMLVTLMVTALLGAILLGDRALGVAAVLSIFGGIYAGYRAARQVWEDEAKR